MIVRGVVIRTAARVLPDCGVDNFVLYGTELLRQLVLVVQVVHQRQRGLAGLVGLPVLLGARPPLP